MTDDEEIVALYFARNQAAISRTAEKYGGFLRAVSVNILHSRADAEECVNDTYFACWNTVPPVRPRSLKAYAGALCRNISFDRYKRMTARKRGGGRIEILLSEIEEFLPSSGPGNDYAETAASAAIDDFLAGLKTEERVVFVRRYWYADEIKDIAARMGFSESRGEIPCCSV